MKLSVWPHEIDYEVRGEGRPLLCVHGVTGSRQVMIDTCEPALDGVTGWQRIYVDLPGHGASTGDPAAVSADDLVHALVRFTAEVVTPAAKQADRAPCLYAYSYGGYLAQGLIRDVPGWGGAFLLCPVVEPDFARRRVPPQRTIGGEDLTYADDLQKQFFTEVAVLRAPGVLERFTASIHPANLAVNRVIVDAARARYVMSRLTWQSLRELDKPVSIVCGRDDHWVGYEDQVTLVRAMSRAELSVVADAGHLLPLEAPDRFRSLFRRWMKRVDAG
jgi:pimeloyl-ACP methyl ester carboxylesterase